MLSQFFETSVSALVALRGLQTLLGSAPVKAVLGTVYGADGRAQLRTTGLPVR